MSNIKQWVYLGLFVALVIGVFSLPGVLSAQTNASDTEVHGAETRAHIGSGKHVELNGTTVTGPVMTGKDVTGTDCSAEHVIGRRVTLTNCKIGQISATKEVVLNQSQISGRITAGADSEVSGSTIEGDLTIRGTAVVKGSVIKGKLSASSDQLTVSDSVIQSINLRHRGGGGGSRVMISGGSVTKGPDGKTLIKVQGNGQAIYGGYTVEGVEQGTQVTTPEGFVYINGQRTGDAGPPTYATLQAEQTEAPNIQGPKWTPGEVVADTSTGGSTAIAPKEPIQFINLKDGAEVTGDITFGSGRGVVRLEKGSVLKGQVIGGVLEQN